VAKNTTRSASTGVLGVGGAFRVASVDYDAIATQVQGTYTSQYSGFQQSIVTMADNWYTQRQAANQNGGPVPDVPGDAIEAAAANYANSMISQSASVQTNQVSAITTSAQQYMKQEGWAAAGAWYSTFAEANSAIADAVRSVEITVWTPSEDAINGTSGVAEALAAFRQGLAADNAKSVISGDESTFGMVKRYLGRIMGWPISQTGNFSIGQALVGATMNGLTDGGNANPIIMFKNMGDYTMTIGEGMAMAALAVKSGVEAAADAAQGAAAVPGLGTVARAGAAAGSGAKLVLSMLTFVSQLMIAAGAVMAIYIPLVPFLSWLGGLVQYFVVVVEGLVAASIGALAHMEAEGEGFGPRTERFYLFLLNALARPALMLFGFFLASALVVLLGGFEFRMFAPAIANSQGNSVTGLVSFIGLLGVFLFAGWSLIQGLFNLVHMLPDQVLGYMGASHSSNIGSDTESKLHGLFLNVSRTKGQAAQAALATPDGKGRARGDRQPVGKRSDGRATSDELR